MLLIADAGNTKTDWALLTSGSNVQHVKGKGISPYFDDDDELSAKILDIWKSLGAPEPAKVIYFGSGCLQDKMKQRVQKALENCYPASSISVDDDLTGAGISLFGNGNGLVAISGTGSNAGIISKGHIEKRVISLGYLLGDEGSGANIGFRFMKKLLSGKLSEKISKDFYQKNNYSSSGLIEKLYKSSRPQTFAASLIPLIEPYREEPDISNILTDSFQSMIDIMILPLLQERCSVPIGFCGSVASIFDKELKSTFRKNGLEIRFVKPGTIEGLISYFSAKADEA